ncbi:DUF4400 domain-containing protein [Thiocapsa sp.]|uniref:DUF4400 domain-containing protein n=1 Tax=Thiocapsa sp. TaxID=2024551 RepID=UPI0026187BBE|nr:DUF4400 domain-containing protein [Thiocapsa sp.]
MWDSANTKEGRGVWLWAVASTLLLFVLELILFASFIPSDWAYGVEQTERRELVETLGADAAQAIVARGARWYDTLFVETGIAPWTYRLVATGPGVESGYGLEPIGASPAWAWLRGRLDVIWGAFAQALRRIALLLAWWPFMAIVLAAAIGDGWLRRRIRQYGFVYASPLAHHTALRILLALWLIVGLLLFAPIAMPVLAVPVLGVASALCMAFVVTNTQKQL